MLTCFLFTSFQVISEELFRNLLLSLVCVTCTTLFLLADLRCCLMVILNVVITLVSTH